ncbi:MAG: c-type cytochrome [Allosphingosinicella sp.]
MKRAAHAALALAALTVLAACEIRNKDEADQSAAKGPPPAAFPPMEKQQGPDVTDDQVRLAANQDGERMFQRRCGVCHLEGGMGTMVLARRVPPDQAKLQDRRDLNPEMVVATVRNGMGAMPRMTRVDVTDAELNAIAAYLSRSRP